MTSDLFNIALDFFYKEHQEQNRQFGRPQEVLQVLLMLEITFLNDELNDFKKLF